MRLSRLSFAFAAVAALAFGSTARADILISIDKSTQRMTVTEDGARLYTWPVSTGAHGYDTPSGEFKPFRMEAEHFSREWDDAPMPHSIFFTMHGHAIHGSSHNSIGRPASHGCVRITPENAAVLFALVKQEGMAHTRVVLSGEIPNAPATPVARRVPRTVVVDDDYAGMAPPRPRYSAASPGWREYRGIDRDVYDQLYVPPRYYAPPPPPPFFRFGR